MASHLNFYLNKGSELLYVSSSFLYSTQVQPEQVYGLVSTFTEKVGSPLSVMLRIADGFRNGLVGTGINSLAGDPIGTGGEIKLQIKETASSPIVLVSAEGDVDWTETMFTNSESPGPYTVYQDYRYEADLPMNGATLRSLLGTKASVSLVMEITVLVEGMTLPYKSQTIPFTIINDVIKPP